MTYTSPEQAPRIPDVIEMMDLAHWLIQQGQASDDAALFVRNAYIAVYDRYCTGSPGYVGKLMSVVWDGAPSFFDVFIWEDGKMVSLDRDADGSPREDLREDRDALLSALNELLDMADNDEVFDHDMDGCDDCVLCRARAARDKAEGR